MRAFTRRYGAHPLHLLALLASFALAGYAAQRLLERETLRVAVWFVGAAVLHDLVLFPLYAIADASLLSRLRRRSTDLPAPPWINYLRIPGAISLVLLLVFSPAIFRLSDIYAVTTDMTSAHYLEHWLLVTAALFGISAVCYAFALRRRRSPRRQEGG